MATTVGVQTQPAVLSTSPQPLDASMPRSRNHLAIDTLLPVNQNGSFEFDRVIKSGQLQKRTKTKTWKTIFLVLRPNTLSIYKSDKEDKLRHKIYLSDLTAVTLLKDPKHKRQNVFGLFSPSKNYHLEAATLKDAQDWVDVIRNEARIEEEEEEMFLASPVVRRESYMGGAINDLADPNRPFSDHERLASSSPEPIEPSLPMPIPIVMASPPRRPSQFDSSGLSGNELASHSDFSDTDGARVLGASIESFPVQSPPPSSSLMLDARRPSLALRNASQASGLNLEQDPDRVVWQGWLMLLRTKRGLRQWKDLWAVLRPRNLILYKDESEYTASFVLPLSAIVDVVDRDPISRSKTYCLQVITEEKSYRFCAHDEDALLLCLGAFKSLLTKRRELEARAAAAATTT